ncbi:MAG TPA: DNA polymerase III subunit delta' [Bacteroidota bacterium]|nr:DNA polymerase III subunit delta' [Bacteroidota bacterium]
MSWDSIVGQLHTIQVLRTAVGNRRLGHAYLLSGADGAGKVALAIEFAKTINCEKRTTEACGLCPRCRRFATLQHPNLRLVFPLPAGKNEKYGDDPFARLPDEEVALIHQEIAELAANPYHHLLVPRANAIKINSVREIRKESSLAMFENGKRVFIIIEAERLGDESGNALLKTLEEPQEDTLLILTTSHPDRLLPTIVSRCQQLRLDPLTDEQVIEALVRRELIAREDAVVIAKLANGNYGRAIELKGSRLTEYRTEITGFLRAILSGPRIELLAEIDRIATEYEKPRMEEFLLLMQSWLHDAMLLEEGVLLQADVMDGETLQKFLARCPHPDYPRVFDVVNRSISLINKNVYIPLILINLALDLRALLDPSEGSRQSVVAGTSEI